MDTHKAFPYLVNGDLISDYCYTFFVGGVLVVLFKKKKPY